MKRKLFAVTLVLALLVSAYTAWACYTTRGLRVYLMDTQLGSVFAGTWQLTLLAAVVLWIPGATVLIRKVSSLKRRGAATPQSRTAGGPIGGGEETELLEPRGGGEETELLEPRGGREETELLEPRGGREETELLEPRGGGEETELLEPRGGGEETELLEPRGDGEETELLKPRGGREETELLESRGSGEETERPTTPAQAEQPPLLCPNCGHPVAGKKFCARCGAKVGRDGEW